MLTNGERALTVSTPGAERAGHGVLARDAAFFHLITGDSAARTAVRDYLLEQAANPANDFPTTLCTTTLEGAVLDAWFYQAAWLLRHVVTYDYVRGSLLPSERLQIENAILRNAYFFAAHNDLGLSSVFPKRLSGDYSVRADAAAAKTDRDKYWTKRYDTNGDCQVTPADDQQAMPVYAYVRADARLGPRITVLSQFYNNRRSAAAVASGAAGALLGDSNLIGSAKRYFMEWLTYGVWPDGSQGEYARNGDYCVGAQGVIYGAFNLQGATLLSRVLARLGDLSLLNFTTADGLFGSETPISGNAKSLELVISTHLKLLTGELRWFFHEPWRAVQVNSTAGMLGNMETHYMGGPNGIDAYHELGLLAVARHFPNQPVQEVVMRDKAVTTLRFPGSTGNPVVTGHGRWNDCFNSLPAVLLLRP
jgi:hypothetical protein